MFISYNQVNFPLGDIACGEIIKIPVVNFGEGMIPKGDGSLEIVTPGTYKAIWHIPCKSTIDTTDSAIIEVRTVYNFKLLGSSVTDISPDEVTMVTGSAVFSIDKPNTLIKLINLSKNTINIPIIEGLLKTSGGATYTVYKVIS